jgi:beta-glucosidase
VITSGGAVEMSSWLDSIPAVIEAWYPGQEGGKVLPQLLFGDLSPSGRLPATFEKRWEDNPVHDNYYPGSGTNRILYKEGVFVGYRGYQHSGRKPLFPFGYGLSYTNFEYSNLAIKRSNTGTDANAQPGYELTFQVRNTGKRAGDDVAQVYVGPPHTSIPRPAEELKAFSRVSLNPGETRTVRLPLDSRSLSYYDVDAKRWHVDPGDYQVLVGRSSEQIVLKGTITLGQ